MSRIVFIVLLLSGLYAQKVDSKVNKKVEANQKEVLKGDVKKNTPPSSDMSGNTKGDVKNNTPPSSDVSGSAKGDVKNNTPPSNDVSGSATEVSRTDGSKLQEGTKNVFNPENNEKKLYMLKSREGGELTRESREFLLDNKMTFDEKVNTVDEWKKRAKEWYDDKKYNDANNLNIALMIAVPRLELIREIRDLTTNINAYLKMKGDETKEEYKIATTDLEKARDLLLKDGTSKIHETARITIQDGMKAIVPLLDGLLKENKKIKTEAGDLELTKTSSKTYVVKLNLKRRESLWRIAEYKDIYNDPWKWKIIYKSNKKQIKDPDLIYPGQKLIIPPVEN